MEHAISQAAQVNPDRRYNPAQTLEEFYDFVDWNVRHLPWDVMTTSSPTQYGQSLYGRTDQGVGYSSADGRSVCKTQQYDEESG